jgi:hypothetical protein
MSRTFHNGDRRIRVKGIRRDPPDLRRLARALLELAEAEAEADAQALGARRRPSAGPRAVDEDHREPAKRRRPRGDAA